MSTNSPKLSPWAGFVCGGFFNKVKTKNKIYAGDQECKRKLQTKAPLEMTKHKGWGKNAKR